MPSYLLSSEELALALEHLNIPRDSGLGGKWPHLAVDYATLLAVYYQFVTTVPFENLDFHRKKPFVLNFPALFNKMIMRKEGGICYELHGMLALLLESLGFTARGVPVVVNRNRDIDPITLSFSDISTHANTFVSFNDEKGCSRRFVCEMGIGTISGPLALELDLEQQTSDGQKYRFRQIDDQWVFLEMWQPRTGYWVARYRVSLQDFDPLDKGTFNKYPFPEAFLSGLVGATQPGAPHQTNVMVYKLRSRDPSWKALAPPPSTVTCSLMDDVYVETYRTFGEPTTRIDRRVTTAEEYSAVLSTFGLRVENPEWPLDTSVILEQDRTLKPVPRFPIFSLELTEQAHKDFAVHYEAKLEHSMAQKSDAIVLADPFEQPEPKTRLDAPSESKRQKLSQPEVPIMSNK